MSVSHHLRIEFPDTADRVSILAKSLSPEAADLVDDRSSTSITVEADTLVIGIDASDLIALRAAANTWIGLLRTAESAMASAATRY